MQTTTETTIQTATATQFPADAVAVDKSTAECCDHNAEQAEAVALGLVAAWKPSDRVLAREAQSAKEFEEAARRKREEGTARAVLAQVNPAGVALGFEAVYSGGGRFSSGYHSGWRLNIGTGYGADANKKWMAVGEGTKLTVTPKQLEKAREKIAEVAAVDAAEKARRSAKQTVEERTKVFIAANPAFCAMVGQSSFNSGETLYYGSGYNRRASYQTAFLVNEDGAVRIGGETLFMDQWTQVFNLKAAQAAAMAALKASFKN